MGAPNHKSKQYTLAVIKIALLIGAGWIIYNRLEASAALAAANGFEALCEKILAAPTLVVLLIFTTLNWFLEIQKWRELTFNTFKLSSLQATYQALTSHTVAILTPAGTGEYIAKAYFFPKKARKDIVTLNGLGNFMQMGVTVFMGILGAGIVVFSFYSEYFTGYTVIVLSLSLAGFFLWPHIQSFGKNFIWPLGKNLKSTHKKRVLAYSVFRYLIFAHQLWILLWLFEIPASYIIVMGLISVFYLISSLMPVLQLFDVVIKGGVALFVFGLVNAPVNALLIATTTMWFLNFALPAVVGGSLLITTTFTRRKHQPLTS